MDFLLAYSNVMSRSMQFDDLLVMVPPSPGRPAWNATSPSASRAVKDTALVSLCPCRPVLTSFVSAILL